MAALVQATDTTSQYLNVPGSTPYLNGSSGGTLMCWVNFGALTSNPINFLIVPTSGGNPRMILTLSAANVLGASIRNADADATSTLVGSGTLATGKWSHVALSYDCVGKVGSFYLNGALAGTASAASASGSAFSATNNSSGGVGVAVNAGIPFLIFTVEDVRIYSRALQSNEILSIYSNKGKDGIVFGLQARWLLNDLTAGNIISAIARDLAPSPHGIIGVQDDTAAFPQYAVGIIQAPVRRSTA